MVVITLCLSFEKGKTAKNGQFAQNTSPRCLAQSTQTYLIIKASCHNLTTILNLNLKVRTLMLDPTQQTPLLSLPYIQGAQAQKHVTHNEALELIDMVVQLTFEALEATIPPGSAAEGQAWAVGAAPTGAWSSHAGDIAAWRGGGWLFATPQIGWRAWDKTTGALHAYDGTGWVVSGGGAAPDLQNLDGLGVNAASDTTNRLAVSSEATLLSHEGAGHQLKINKATTTDSASLLYQSNWSGRAEMGLAGNDNFSIKVSTDGITFTESLRIDAATGAVALPATGARQLMPFNYRYYFYTDRRWIGPSANTATLNATQSLGTGAEPAIDWDGKGIYVPAGSIIRSLTFAGNSNSTQIADIDLRLVFKHGPWNAGWNSTASTTRVVLHSADSAGLIGNSGMCNAVYTLNFTTPADGYFAAIVRPNLNSTLTATRTFYAAGALDVILPPSA